MAFLDRMISPDRNDYVAGLADQTLQSGVNFAMMIFLARFMDTGEFGLFAMGQVVGLFFTVVHISFVAEPFSVNFARYHGRQLSQYVHWNNSAFYWICGAGCGGLGAMASLLLLLGWPSSSKVFFCAALAFPTYLVLWHTRRLCYALKRARQALAGTALYALLLIGGIGVVAWMHRLNACLAMIVFAIAGASLLVPLIRNSWRTADMGASAEAKGEWFRLHWEYARWHMGGSVLAAIGNFVVYPVLAAGWGIATIGSMRIIETFYAPINQGMTALAMVLVPRMAALQESTGIHAVEHVLRDIRILLLIGVGVTLAAVAATGDSLVCLFVGPSKGAGLGLPAVLYGTMLLVRIVIDLGPAMILRLKQDTRAFMTNGWVAGIGGTVLVGFFATHGLMAAIGARVGVTALSGLVFIRAAAKSITPARGCREGRP